MNEKQTHNFYSVFLLYLFTIFYYLFITDYKKNLAIASRLCVSCAHNTSKASIITPGP